MGTSPADLASQLVRAFGRPDDIAAILTDDAAWWISPSVPEELLPSLTKGRQHIHANMKRVFDGDFYDGPTMSVVIHHAIAQGNMGVVRFTLSGNYRRGGTYNNEYTVWIEARDTMIAQVWEYVDVAHAFTQMATAGLPVPTYATGDQAP